MLLPKRNIKLIIISSLIAIILLFTTTVNAKSGYWVHLVNINNPIPLEQIKSRYQAYDKEDGNLTNQLSFETSYNHISCKIGEYDLKVTVTNTKNITTKQIDKIIVRDFVRPTIYLDTSSITVPINYNNIKEIIKNHIIYSDNLDQELLVENIIINNLPSTLEEKAYNISVFCLDSSTNASNIIEIELNVIDNSKNTILKNIISVFKKHSKDEILNLLKEEHTIPKDCNSIAIESNYFDKNSKPGIYNVRVIIIHNDDSREIITFKLNYTENTKNFPMWIYITLGGFITLIIIFIIIYRKRNQ